MGASLTQGHVHFSYGCDFMMGLCTKFEVASFSHCVNIEGKPQILGSSPSSGPPHSCFGVIFTARSSYASAVIILCLFVCHTRAL